MKSKGQSLVEFSVALVIIMIVLSGIAEFGIVFFQFVQLRDAVQEGALYGSACHCGAGEIEMRVRGASNTPLNLADPNIVVTVSVNDGMKDVSQMCEADALKVQATYPHHLFMPFMSRILGRQDLLLNASVTDTVLSPRCSS